MATVCSDPGGRRRILFVAPDGGRKAIRLGKITPADGERFKTWLVARGCARARTAKWIRYARHFFALALRRKLIAESPFAYVKGGLVVGDPARRKFVPADEVRFAWRPGWGIPKRSPTLSTAKRLTSMGPVPRPCRQRPRQKRRKQRRSTYPF